MYGDGIRLRRNKASMVVRQMEYVQYAARKYYRIRKEIGFKMIRVKPGLVKAITFGFAAAITLWPFGIYLRDVKYLSNRRMLNHESIHWEQQKELGGILFYVLYLIEWIIKLFIYGRRAYINLSSEREAYHFDDDMDYLEARKRYQWLKYIFKKP